MNNLNASAVLKFAAFMAALVSVEGDGKADSEKNSGLSARSSSW